MARGSALQQKHFTKKQKARALRNRPGRTPGRPKVEAVQARVGLVREGVRG